MVRLEWIWNDDLAGQYFVTTWVNLKALYLPNGGGQLQSGI